MGGNRKKKVPVVQNSNSKIQLTSPTTCSKPDEAAASSMSSESSNELIFTSSDLLKSKATLHAKNNNNNNSIKTSTNNHVRNEDASLWGKTIDDTEFNFNSRTAFRFSWNEILALCFLLVTFAICSIVVGVAAGVSISIHYYESPENLDQRRVASATITNDNTQFWESRLATHTVTSVDPTIFIYSKNYYPSMGDRVVHTDTATGMRIPLNVVVESPTLPTDAQYIPQSNWTSIDQTNTTDYYQNEHTIIPPPSYTNFDNNFDAWLHNPPKLCSDSKTMGYDSWSSLRYALNDVNRYSAQRSERWLMYFASLAALKASSPDTAMFDTVLGHPSTIIQGGISIFDDDNLYYEEQFTFTICPRTVLHAGSHPLVIDTESVTLQCDGCIVTGGDSHISFGSAAKNTLIRGITFQNSKRSSILLHHNGAEVTFEDCIWAVTRFDSDKRHRHIMPGLNEITNVNSSIILNFYRCSTFQQKLSRFFPLFWWRAFGNS
jgi:hypothetical protein